MTMTTGTLGDLPTDQQVLGADKAKDKKVVVPESGAETAYPHGHQGVLDQHCWSNDLRLCIC